MAPRASRPADPRPAAGLGTAPILLYLLAALAALAVLRLCFGSSAFGWPEEAQVLRLRVVRMAIACTVGAALAVSGVGLQTLLRNPLAEPFILGLSTGAGMGIMGLLLIRRMAFADPPSDPDAPGLLVRVLTWLGDGPLGPVHMGALAGGALTLGIVYVAARRQGVIDPLGLLLVGVVLSTINGGIIMFLNYAVGTAGLRENIAAWMMGQIDEAVGRPTIMVVAAMTLIGLLVLWWHGRAMDVATFSDAEAQSLGVHLGRLRLLLFAVASLLASGAVVLAGPIAFIGLICPHLARLMLGPRHRPLLIASAAIGAGLIMLADITSISLHWAFNWGLMPLGIFTAILGGLSFLWMLRPRLGAAAWRA